MSSILISANDIGSSCSGPLTVATEPRFEDSVRSSGGAATFKPAGLLRVALKPGEDNDLLLLNKPELTLGRDASNDVSIVSVEISRKHCIFKFEDGRWWIVDLNSTNGVFISGIRLKAGEKVMLEDGHRISFGPEANSSYKYLFREDMSHHPHAQLALSSSSTSQTIIDLSGYESVATQDLENRATSSFRAPQSPSPSPSPSPSLLPRCSYENLMNQIVRLRLEKAQGDNKMKDLQEQNRSIQKQLEYRDSKLYKLEKKCSALKEEVKKHRNWISQVKDRTKNDTNANRCVTATAMSETLLSNILSEFSCSICSEYFVSPTCLGCSHVFCLSCIEQWKKEYHLRYNQISNGICPVCRTEIESQTPMRPYENLIDLLLNAVLDAKQKEDRARLVEERKATQAKNRMSLQNPLFDNLLQQLLTGMRVRQRSSGEIAQNNDAASDVSRSTVDNDQNIISAATAAVAAAVATSTAERREESGNNNNNNNVDGNREEATERYEFELTLDSDDDDANSEPDHDIEISLSDDESDDDDDDDREEAVEEAASDSDQAYEIVIDENSVGDIHFADDSYSFDLFLDRSGGHGNGSDQTSSSDDDEIFIEEVPPSTHRRRRRSSTSSVVIISDGEDAIQVIASTSEDFATAATSAATAEGNNSRRSVSVRPSARFEASSSGRRAHPYRRNRNRATDNNNGAGGGSSGAENVNNHTDRRATICA